VNGGTFRRWTGRRAWRLWLLLAFVVYTLVGFFVVPGVVRSRINRTVVERLGWQGGVARAAFNPFTLTLTLEGLALREPDGTPFASLDRLRVNAELLATLWNRGASFKSIDVTRPAINLIRYSYTDNNLGRLANAAKRLSPPEPRAERKGKLIRLVIARLAVAGGAVSVADRTVPETYEVDITPIDFTVTDFSTIPDREGRYTLTAKLGGGTITWTSTYTVNPLHASGTFAFSDWQLPVVWRRLEHQLPFEVRQGVANLSFDYTLDGAGERLGAAVDNLRFGLDNVAIVPKSDAIEVFRVARASIEGGRLRWPEQTVEVAAVAVAGTRVVAWRRPDGTISLFDLVPTALPTLGPPAEETAAQPRAPWAVKVDRVALEDFSASFEDRMVEPVATLGVDDLDVVVEGYELGEGKKFRLDVAALLASGGTLKLAGIAGIQPPTLDAGFEARDIAVLPAQPYLATQANLRLVSGRIGAKGRVTSGPDELLALRADFSLDEFAVDETPNGERFLAVAGLRARNARVDLERGRVAVDTVALEAPYARLIVAADGTTNLTNILAPMDEATPAAVADAPAVAFDASIGQITVANGSATFADLSLPLPFATGIEALGGSITRVASADDAPAAVDLHGRIGAEGTADIVGDLSLFGPTDLLELDVDFTKVEMAGFTPYSVKFAGYRVASGLLDLDLHYSIRNRKLASENRIVAEQLTLGEKVPSETAIKLPLKLAVALLKDSEGVIRLDIPLTGTVDDPKFSIWGLAWQAIKIVLTKVVVSPFKALAAMFGSDEDLGLIPFAAASAELSAEAQARLGRLAEALARKPELVLELAGAWDPVNDGAAIRAARAGQALDSQLAAQAPVAGETPELATRRALEALLLASLTQTELDNLRAASTVVAPSAAVPAGEAPPARLDEAAYAAALRRRLEELQTVDEPELRALGERRGAAITDLLNVTLQVPTGRLQTGPARPVEAPAEAGVDVRLGLSVPDAQPGGPAQQLPPQGR
jgi:hypothetical protein